jgi:uncharacterized protein YjbI with pentapeptide repeats
MTDDAGTEPVADRPAAEHTDSDLRGVDWARRELRGERFLRCTFYDADLSEATLDGCVFVECDLSGVAFNASAHQATAFVGCRFRRTSFFDATLTGCKLSGSVFEEGCTLRPLTVDGGDWSFVSLRRQDLSGLDLTGLRLAEADLTGADLRATVLAKCDLSRAVLREARLAGADLRGADLTAVDLRVLDLTGTRIDVRHAVALAAAYGAEVSVEPDQPAGSTPWEA